MPTDQIMLVNDPYISMVALREAHYENLTKAGDSTKGQIVGEYSVEVGSPKAVAIPTVVNHQCPSSSRGYF